MKVAVAMRTDEPAMYAASSRNRLDVHYALIERLQRLAVARNRGLPAPPRARLTMRLP